MNPAMFLQDLRQRGVQIEYRLSLKAPANCLMPSDRERLQQQKPLLAKLLIENELAALIQNDAAKPKPSQPGKSNARIHMLNEHASVTHDPTNCYMWSREELGYGWWYASEFPPPNW